MTEEQKIETTEATEDVEGHHHHGMGKKGPLAVNAEDQELTTDDDDVEGHHHHGMGKK